MPRIRCHYLDCQFIDEGFCSAAAIEIDPDTGCNTYTPNSEAGNEDDWTEEEELEEWDEQEEDEEDDDELWPEEEEES